MDINNPHRPPTESELTDVNEHWEDENRDYDPNRGDHVDHLNDTTPPPPAAPKPKRQHGKRWPWVLLVLVLLLAGGAAYYHFGMKKSAAPAKTTATTANTPAVAQKAQPVAVTTKHYDSSNFNLGLDYPTTWKMTDTETKLTVISPAMTVADSTGKNVSGHVMIMIRPRQTTLPEFAAGAATAVIESPKIAYTKPTQNQRAQTYLGFLDYAGTKTNGLDAIYVNGDNGYKAGQSVPMSDVIQTDPLVTVSFLSCASDDCTGTTTALSLSPDNWKAEAFSKPITTTLTSLTLN